MHYKYIYLFLALSLLISCKSVEKTAQDNLAWNDAANAIKEVKKGGLVILIPSHKEKFKAVNRLLQSKELSEKKKEKIRLDKENDLENIREYSKKMIGAFREGYDFSPLYFLPDSSFNAFKKGQRKNIFLNDNMEIDKSITMEFPDSYRVGIRLGSDQIIVIRDKDGQIMKEPFPWRHTYYFWMGVGFNAWVDNIEAMKSDAIRFSRSFKNFYRRVKTKELNSELN